MHTINAISIKSSTGFSPIDLNSDSTAHIKIQESRTALELCTPVCWHLSCTPIVGTCHSHVNRQELLIFLYLWIGRWSTDSCLVDTVTSEIRTKWEDLRYESQHTPGMLRRFKKNEQSRQQMMPGQENSHTQGKVTPSLILYTRSLQTDYTREELSVQDSEKKATVYIWQLCFAHLI